MRVLFTACPAYGHILPMLPLARAALRRGHEVLFATGADLVGQVRERGLAAEPAGPTFAQMRAIREQRYPDFDTLPGDQRLPAGAVGLFGLPAVPRSADIQAIARRWRPDLLVHEVMDIGGPMAALRLGLPSATHGFGPFLPYHPSVLAAASEAVGRPELTEYLLEVAPYVDISPAMLNPPVPHPFGRRVPLRPSAGEAGPPTTMPALERLPYDRTVYLSLGTVFNTAVPVLAAAIEAIRELPVNLVVTTGPGVEPARFHPQPEHVVVAQFLPQARVLEHCHAVVSQSGSGGMLGAFSFGLPQVCLPLGADQFLNAEAVERVNAGIAVLPEGFSVTAVRDALEEVLADCSYTDAARAVQAEIAFLPEPDEALDALIGGLAGALPAA